MSTDLNIRFLTSKDKKDLRIFCETHIATGYYSESDYEKFCGEKVFLGASVAAVQGNHIIGVRLTYGSGEWFSSFSSETLFIEKLGIPIEKIAYFKTIFVFPAWTGKGLGGRLSQKSLELLKQEGCAGVICHSVTNFSQNNSSQKYLAKLGFKSLGVHEKFWKDISGLYCNLCSSEPCLCDAEEMYLNLEGFQ